ncbi:MAG: hypothetical protein WCH84_02530 [Verrucomicrobiota bacterium]
MMILAVFMPWKHISGSFTASYGTGHPSYSVQLSNITLYGIKKDAGVLGLICGLIAMPLCIWGKRWATIPAVSCAILGIASMADRNTGTLSGGSGDPGGGVFLFTGAAVLLIMFTLPFWKRQQKSGVAEEKQV